MRLWIDDIKQPPDETWIWAKSYKTAVLFILKYKDKIAHISFDHDLGEEKTGYDIAKFIEYGAFLRVMPVISWHIHSSNPVGSENIRRAMQRAAEYWRADLE